MPTPLEKAITIFAKQNLDEAIELYNSLGLWLHDRIAEDQKRIAEKLNHRQAQKEKLTK